MNNNKLIIKELCKDRFQVVVDGIEALLKSHDSPIIIAIDGKCASGKTSLGYYLQQVFDCNLFHMDDFFLQNKQRTQERLNAVGGNVDYERFQIEVIQSIINKETILYRPYDCKQEKIRDPQTIPFKRLNIIEGSYSHHPYFKNVYHLRVFLSLSDKEQIKRIRKRNGDAILKRFKKEWIPKENDYFDTFQIESKSLVIYNENRKE